MKSASPHMTPDFLVIEEAEEGWLEETQGTLHAPEEVISRTRGGCGEGGAHRRHFGEITTARTGESMGTICQCCEDAADGFCNNRGNLDAYNVPVCKINTLNWRNTDAHSDAASKKVT